MDRFAGLNAALGKASLDEARKLSHFKGKETRYNREVSAVITDIRKALRIVTLAPGDWAARDILRNKFKNALTAAKREQKMRTTPLQRAQQKTR